MPLVLDGTNGVSGVDGTASNPAIEGTDSNTGIFYPAADTVAIGTGGTEALRVNSSQNVGIGTTSPAEKLDVVGVYVQAADTRTNNTNKLFGLRMPHYANATAAVNLIGAVSTSGGNALYIGGNDTSFAGTAATSIQFYTAATGSVASGTQRMTLDASGNLLVGTTSGSYAITARRAPATNANQIMLEAYRTTGADSGVGDYLSTANGLYGHKYIGSNWFGSLIGTSGIVFHTGTLGSETERARITSDGDFLIGRTGQWATGRLCIQKRSGAYNTVEAGQGDGGGYNFYSHAASNGGTYYHANFTEAGTSRGSITSNGSTTSYVTTSDYRLKENVQPMTGALAKVSQLKPCTYLWKDSGVDGEGFIAHELGEVCPQAVVGQKDAVDAEGNPIYQGVDTSFLVATLTAAIQEQQAMIDELKAKVAALESA